MSYASVAASNISPDSPQPQPDPALLNTTSTETDNVADDAAKINIVGHTFKQDPHTYTSENALHLPKGSDDVYIPETSDRSPGYIPETFDRSPVPDKPKTKRRLREVEAEGAYIWDTVKHYLLRPGVAGGVIGLVNVGLLASLGSTLYQKPNLRKDTGFITTTIATTLGLVAIEGYAAERYWNIPLKKGEKRGVEENPTYRKLQQVVLRPNVFGGLLGFANLSIVGVLGYFSYVNWGRSSWDRRVVSSITIGLVTLLSGESWLATRYRQGK